LSSNLGEASLVSSIDIQGGFDTTQERDRPPLRPPRPKRTLGGTNFRADIVDVRSSTSASVDELWIDAALSVISRVGSEDFEASGGMVSRSKVFSVPLERCSL